MQKRTIETADGIKLTVSSKIINPELAKQILSSRDKNRGIQTSRIRRYAHGMKEGEWVIAQPILFDENGSLLDGQHRMRAVITANVPVEFLCVEGYPRDHTFCKLDDVAKRNLRDWLHIMGVEQPKVAAAVTSWAARDAKGLIPAATGGHFILTPIEGVEFFEAHPEIEEAVVAPGTTNTYLPRSLSSFAFWKFAQYDKTEAKGFFVDLTCQNEFEDGDPIFLLRERMKRDKLSKERLSQIEKLALVYKAWNAVRAGKRLKALLWRSTGPTAEKFPEVI